MTSDSVTSPRARRVGLLGCRNAGSGTVIGDGKAVQVVGELAVVVFSERAHLLGLAPEQFGAVVWCVAHAADEVAVMGWRGVVSWCCWRSGARRIRA
ncbi:hypothetical protein [Mycobacteroides salmoniphilum]|uniref:hypothetical protein n=1 Tax=Mycobacteroides salmoniphilum TaxID=404941 RepID=UPI001065F44F|nr:hypothetical protein [Mycobacteroides salmoniphilum]